MTLGPRTALCQEDVEVCDICLGLVLKAHTDKHKAWHKTMTNLPWAPPPLPSDPPPMMVDPDILGSA